MSVARLWGRARLINYALIICQPSLTVGLLPSHKFEKGFAYDYLVTVFKRLFGAGRQARSAVDEGPVRAPEVLDQILVVQKLYPGVAARDFGFRIVLVQVDVREDASVGVPAADHRLSSADRKLFANLAAALNDQFGADRGAALIVAHSLTLYALGVPAAAQRIGLPVEGTSLTRRPAAALSYMSAGLCDIGRDIGRRLIISSLRRRRRRRRRGCRRGSRLRGRIGGSLRSLIPDAIGAPIRRTVRRIAM